MVGGGADHGAVEVVGVRVCPLLECMLRVISGGDFGAPGLIGLDERALYAVDAEEISKVTFADRSGADDQYAH